MTHKRHFVDDDSNNASCKHPRQLEQIDHLALPVPVNGDCYKPTISDGEYSLGELEVIICSANNRTVSNEFKNFEIGACTSFPPFFWFSNGIHEADNLSFFPEYFDHVVHQPRVIHKADNVSSSIDYPLQKSVPIGPDHQVFVPEWKDQNTLGQSSADTMNEERLMGISVIPLPKSEISPTQGSKTDCGCPDRGSIECVKQHLGEARQRLREKLGEEIFEELGFNDMGEDVASKWTEVEEEVFHDVVLSNPVSLGRNFWENLSVALPMRKKKELVSYYFNVFMLGVRCEQNRFEPLNIDSDNDEWQSPNEQDAPVYDLEEDCNEEDEISGIKEEHADNDVKRAETDEECEGDIDDNSMAHDFKLFKNSGNDVEVEDGSCTSYEYPQDNAE